MAGRGRGQGALTLHEHFEALTLLRRPASSATPSSAASSTAGLGASNVMGTLEAHRPGSPAAPSAAANDFEIFGGFFFL